VEEKEAAAEAQAKAQAQAAADAQTQAQAQAEVQAAAVAEVKADPTALAEKLRLLEAEETEAFARLNADFDSRRDLILAKYAARKGAGCGG